MKNAGSILIALLVALILLSMSAFSVDQREYAMVFRLGEVVSVKKDPGLYFKMPLVENVRRFDKRILTLEWGDPERFITSEKKNVLVDSFVKWRIIDPSRFYVSVRGGDEAQAEARLSQTVNDGLRAEFGRRTINAVVSGSREEIMSIIRAKADQDARTIGVQVVDVREPHEYTSGHVPGAVLIPINPVTGFMQRKDELSREVPIIFVCGVGQRSALACEVAAALGFADLYNLEGGTEDWIKSGQPVQK